MKLIAGLFLIILSVFLALYVGVWLCFIGGITEMIHSVQASPMDAIHFAIGLAKFLGAGILVWLTFFITLMPGCALLIAWLEKR